MTETPARGATTQTIRNGPAHENFLSAVRALVEFTFLQKAEYQILGNWLIPPSTDDQGQDGLRLLLPSIYTPSPCRGMFKLNVNLAASGELYIAPERNSSILLQRVNAVPPPVEGTLLFLSPSGARAEFVSILPSTSQTSPILQKIRMTTGLEAKFPLMRVRLTGSGVDTLWPVNLAFQKCASRNITSLDTIDYFNLKDGVSAAVKLISDALTYKPPPAPSPAIPPSVAAHVTPSGAYHTPPDGLVRTKPASLTGQTPTVNQNSQEDWITSTKDEDDIWPAVTNVRDEDETFMFDESVFDLEEEDFDFFDDGPSGEIDETLETLVSEFRPPEEQTMVVAEPRPQPVEEMRLERPSSPPPEEHEPQMVLSPPYSPLRILPSPPPSKRGSFPRVWDHVRLSGNLEKLQDKYRRGGKYWCDDLDENALEDDSMSESSSEDERVDIMATNPRKRKRDGDEDEGNSTVRINGPTIGAQNLDSDSISLMTRAIDDNFLLLQNPRDDFIKRMPKRDDRQGAYTSGLDTDEFIALAETVAAQVAWDGLVAVNNDREQDTISLDDFNSVVTEIWGMDAANNPGLKELTEVTDNLPSDEEESPQMKTPRMKPVRSHNPPASTLSLSGLEQTPSIYPIPPSSFLVHRIVNRVAPAPNHTQRLSVSQPALRFWEKFSFSPVAGEKDVQCYIVHPDSDGMAAAAESFLSEVQTGWESCGMGKFERGKVNEGKDGMIAISVPPNAEEDMYLSAYEDALVAFGITSLYHSY